MNSCIETERLLTGPAGLLARVRFRPEGRTHAPLHNGDGGLTFFNHQPASCALRIDHCDSGFNMGRAASAAKLSALAGAPGAKRR
jgi:hypothetical protein